MNTKDALQIEATTLTTSFINGNRRWVKSEIKRKPKSKLIKLVFMIHGMLPENKREEFVDFISKD